MGEARRVGHEERLEKVWFRWLAIEWGTQHTHLHTLPPQVHFPPIGERDNDVTVLAAVLLRDAKKRLGDLAGHSVVVRLVSDGKDSKHFWSRHFGPVVGDRTITSILRLATIVLRAPSRLSLPSPRSNARPLTAILRLLNHFTLELVSPTALAEVSSRKTHP